MEQVAKQLGLLSLLLFISACASSGKKSEVGGLPTGKMTADLIENRVPLEVQVAYSPRRAKDIEAQTLADLRVQQCLRSAPDIRETDFLVAFEGTLNHVGQMGTVVVTASNTGLKECLTKFLPLVAYGRGRSGPFQIRITRSKPPETPESGPVGFLLDLTSPKKWE